MGGGPPHRLLFGLAPGGVCRAPGVATGAVRSCHPSAAGWRPRDPDCSGHRFALTHLRPDKSELRRAVCFLWHFPSPIRPPAGGLRRTGAWALPSTLPCGARTFLPRPPSRKASADESDHPTPSATTHCIPPDPDGQAAERAMQHHSLGFQYRQPASAMDPSHSAAPRATKAAAIT